MRDGLKRENSMLVSFFLFFPRTNVARFDIILAENCFSQFYETRKLRSLELLRGEVEYSGGGKKNRSGKWNFTAGFREGETKAKR